MACVYFVLSLLSSSVLPAVRECVRVCKGKALRCRVDFRVGLLTTGRFCYLYIILYPPVWTDIDWVWSGVAGALSASFETLRCA